MLISARLDKTINVIMYLSLLPVGDVKSKISLFSVTEISAFTPFKSV